MIIKKVSLELILSIIFSLMIIRGSILNISFPELEGLINIGIFLLFILIIIYYMEFSIIIIFPLLLIFVISASSIINMESMSQLKSLTTVYMLLIVLFSTFKNYNIDKLFNYILFISTVLLIISYFMYFMGIQPTISEYYYIFTGPILGQNNMAVILFSLLLLILNLKDPLKDSFYVNLILYILIISIFLTQSRGALLSMLIVLFYYYRKKMIYILFTLPVFISVFLYSNEAFMQRLLLKSSQSIDDPRLYFWTEIINSSLNNFSFFLFGRGINAISVDFTDKVFGAHSSFMNFFASYGFLAFSVLLILLAIIFILSSKNKLLTISLFVILVYGVFETILFERFTTIWITFIILFSSRHYLFQNKIFHARRKY